MIKIKGNKLKIELISVTSLILIMLIFLLIRSTAQNEVINEIVGARIIECVKDSDCIIARGSCCSCENGGTPVCIAKTKIGDYANTLTNCLGSGTCTGLNCGKISCGCVNNKCTSPRV